MKKIAVLVLILISFNVISQSIKTQVLENLLEIKSVNPNNTDFLDLELIGKSIGKAKVVFLGEQDHGDATTFEAKTRIIKYLHEKKGFNVLAFESDFFNINKKSDENKSIDEIEKSIFSIWSKCAQVNPLFDYIKKQNKINPIKISGFDCQIGQNSDSDKYNYLNTIEEYIKIEVEISNIKDYEIFKKTLSDLLFFVKKTKEKKAHFKKVKKRTQIKFFKVLREIKAQIKAKKSFLFKALENSEYYAKMAWKNKQWRQGRDIQMGKNIIWLKDKKFPDDKIIIWAHSAHLVKGEKNIFSHTKTSAGKYVCDNLNKSDVYSIGFTSRIGYTNRITTNVDIKGYEIKNIEKEGIESWIYSKKIRYAFINFKTLKNNSERFHMKGVSHNSNKNNWLFAFDGLFYIDEMFPCIEE